MTAVRTWKAARWPAAAVVLLAGLVAAGTVTRPGAADEQAARSSSLPVTETAVVCPNVTGSDTAPTTMTIANVSGLLPGGTPRRASIRTTPLSGSKARTTSLPSRAVTRVNETKTGYPVLVEASGPGAGAVVADQQRLIPHGTGRGLFSTPCLEPGTDWWITGADGRVGYADTLVLANPGSTTVNLTVSGWSTKGPFEPPRLQSFTVAPSTAYLLALSRFAPDAALMTLHVHANSGRLVSAAIDRRISGIRAAGVDWIPPTLPPATDVVVPGFIGGTGPRQLILADPGDQDATVTLKLATTTGNFVPAGHQTVVVRAGRTAVVDLTASLSAVPGAVVIHSDQPVTAAAISSATGAGTRARPDIQWQPAGRAITGPAVLPDNTPPFDRNAPLYVTAPESAAKLRVTAADGSSTVLSVRTGRTLAWDPVGKFGRPGAYGPLVFTPVSGGPVYVARTLVASGVHGPLTTSEQPTLLPVAISLPAAEPDLRVAVPGRP